LEQNNTATDRELNLFAEFSSIIYMCLEASKNRFWVIFAGKLPDAASRYTIYFSKVV